MIGEKKGLLTILEFSHKKATNNYWKANCKCGNVRIISTGEWNRNRTPVPSCGCYRKIDDYTGKKFNSLEVIKFYKIIKHLRFWICKCVCGKEVITDIYSLKVGKKKSCGCQKKLYFINKFGSPQNRFLKKVLKKEDGCWEWIGCIAPNGYGSCGMGYVFPEQRAHRCSFRLFVGEIPNNLWVLHKCDNKKCVNPDHLYLGTVKDNVKDAIERGHWPIGKNKKKGSLGEKNNKAKLSNDDVVFIRNSKMKNLDLSKKFNVHIGTIQMIKRKGTWTHI